MTQQPYELLVRFSPDGTVAGAIARYLQTVDGGRAIEGDPVPLANVSDDPVFAEFATRFNTGLIAERDAYRQNLDECTRQLEIAHSQVEESDRQLTEAQQRIAELVSEIELLRNPPAPLTVTPAQLRIWLIQHSGADVLTQIALLVNSIEDPAQREIARVKWEYSIDIHRNDPLLVQFGHALGLTDEQMDVAFVEASQL